jgi:hypothetical protein
MFFGYGKSSSRIEIPGSSDQFILTTFAYFHLIFLLRITFARKWFLVETAKSDQVKIGDKIIISQKPLQKWEVDNLLHGNPVNVFWRLFNQSLVWLILGILVVTASTNFLATGSVIKAPARTISQIIESKYWDEEEEKLVIENASDEDFLKFLGKFKSKTLAKKALTERINIKNLKTVPNSQDNNSNNSVSINSSSAISQ